MPSPVTSTFDGLMSRCRTPAVVGVLERLGHAGAPPGDRLREASARQGRPARRPAPRRRPLAAARAGRAPRPARPRSARDPTAGSARTRASVTRPK